MNFTLIIPLLNILFDAMPADSKTEIITSMPDFTISIDYVKQLFQYYFYSILQENGKFATLIFVAAIVIASVILTNVFRYLAQIQIEFLKAQAVNNLRDTLYSKILNFHVGYFNTENKGNIITKVTNDVGEVYASIASTLSTFFKEPLSMIVFMVTLFMMSYKLTLFTLLIIPVSGLLISVVIRSIKRDARLGLESYGRIMTMLDETINSIKVVKSFNAEAFMLKKFKTENHYFNNLARKVSLKNELVSPFSEASGVFVVSFILIYGGHLVLNNNSELSASEFITYIIIFSQLLRPAKAITASYASMQKGIAAAERILNLLDEEVKFTDAPDAKIISNFNSEIKFEKVTFSHSERTILKSIDLTIKKGTLIALVGPSGGGKSTLADLIPRFYDPQEGVISIDGVDIKNYQMASVRSLMGIVTQESMLFNDTIYNNIAFGKQNCTKEEVEEAARIANAHEFILQTDHGYDTIVGDRGIRLSGGQKQRISIARAVIKNPPIMILDEATSALDTESEKLVQAALDNLMQNRTTIVIAHRLSTIQHADEILVIKDGEIVERGTHNNLINIDRGVYNKLQKLQS
ncbi:MAG: ABC transporter ATP-binding protein [Bacteroidota bacterium]|nr:ABC transporter ATP-binding protein [Bacteroidota bacterium]